jgi:FtsH-binding integral membrane protein
MIAWTNTKLKFTSGIGALGTTALLADISQKTLPVWLVMVIALVPVTVFVFVRPDEMSRSIVLPLQIFASLWYLVLSVILSVLFFRLAEKERGWPIYFICLAVGTIPCFVVLWKWLDPEARE